jgi:chitin disaccharide deacetylase
VTTVLIVNADDWGLDQATTDAIGECFERRAISSTTAMVWMSDSARASTIARERVLPVGLHLNLDTSFADNSAPGAVHRSHERAVEWFGRAPSHFRMPLNPSRRFQQAVDASIAAQLDEFRSRYGVEPTHVDGHHHVHLAPNVLFSAALPSGLKIRGTVWPSSKARVRLLRALRSRVLRHRFRTTEWFYDIRALHPQWGGSGLEPLDRARTASVEVMVHPGFADELPVLLSPEWIREINSRPLGSFARL